MIFVHRFAVVIAIFFLGGYVHATTCFDIAGERHGVAPKLLYVIAQHESAMNPRAINRNKDGSVDIGLMQINSRWLPSLARYGISSEALFDPCTSADVGAWILAANFRRYGVNWMGLGAYNASNHHLRERYAKNIAAKLKSLISPPLAAVCQGQVTLEGVSAC